MLLKELDLLLKTTAEIPQTAIKIKHVQEICSKNKQLKSLLHKTLDPKVRFYLKSDSMKKHLAKTPSQVELSRDQNELDLMQLLNRLSSRDITGNEAKDAVALYLASIPEEYHKLVFSILDKKLYLRLSFDTIFKTDVENALLNIKMKPALAHLFDSKRKQYFLSSLSEASWYASQKFDGVRGLLFLSDEASPFSTRYLLSRNGKPFRAFPPQREHKIVTEILKLHPHLHNHILDGELVEPSGSFQQTIANISTEDCKAPVVFHAFDAIEKEAFLTGEGDSIFSDRICRIPSSENIEDAFFMLRKVNQEKVTSEHDLNLQLSRAEERGWEGIMLRKDVEHVGKRTKDLLKLKSFTDAEYKIIDIEVAPMRLYLNGSPQDLLAVKNVIINYKGLSSEERITFAKEPSMIIGKVATVQFFSEFEPSINKTDDDANPGLRFASVKKIWLEGKRKI